MLKFVASSYYYSKVIIDIQHIILSLERDFITSLTLYVVYVCKDLSCIDLSAARWCCNI